MSDNERLAEAMSKLADAMNNFSDPVRWQKTISDAVRVAAGLPQVEAELTRRITAVLPSGVALQAIAVELSEDQRREMAAEVMAKLEPQLVEFRNFVQTSLKEMPAHRLKELAEKIKAGAKPLLRRRAGCVFVELDTGEETYLNL